MSGETIGEAHLTKYRCPKHGEIGNTAMVLDFPKIPELNLEHKQKKFCFLCYMAMVEQGCCEVEEI